MPAPTGFSSLLNVPQYRPSTFTVQDSSDPPAPTAQRASQIHEGAIRQRTLPLTGPPSLRIVVVNSSFDGGGGERKPISLLFLLTVPNASLLQSLGKEELAGEIYSWAGLRARFWCMANIYLG